MNLADKHRPKTWEQFVGNDAVVKRIRAVIGRAGFGDGAGEMVYLSGASGTGKTTAAHLIARALGVEPGGAWNYLEIDGDKCSVDEVRALDDRTMAAGLYRDCWQVFLVNEAHAMSPRAVQAWLTLAERLPARWLVIFTTTREPDSDLFGEFTEPLLSRCKVFQLTSQGLAQPFAEHVRRIAQAEGLDGKPEAWYLRLIQAKHNNLRAALQAVDAGEAAA